MNSLNTQAQKLTKSEEGFIVIDDLNYDNRYFHKTKRHASDDEGYDAMYRDYSLKYGNLV